MLNTFLRHARSRTALVARQSWSVELARVQLYASFTLRDVLNDRSDEAGTLLTRFSKHIAMERYNDGARELVPTKIRYADFFPITDDRYLKRELSKVSADQVPALIIYASTYRSNAQPPKYALLTNELDATALAQLENMNMYTVLEALYAFLFLMPNWIMRLDFYKAAMQRLVVQWSTETASKQAFVQICFYLGLNKKNPETAALLKKFLEQHLSKYLPELIDLDLAIICNAAFKTGTVVESLPDFDERLKEAVLKLPPLKADSGLDALLVTYIKSMRLQRIQSTAINERLAALCDTDELALLQPSGVMHLFAYFADRLWDQPDSVATITKHCLAAIKQGSVRAKDLATFAWCCAQVDCELTPPQLQELVSIAMRKLDNEEYGYFPDNLVNTCLSLWILGQHSRELFTAAVELKSEPVRKPTKAQPKVDSRLTVLISAAAITHPKWFSDLKVPKSTKAFTPKAVAPAYLLKERSDITALAKQLSAATQVSEVQLVCPINGINIPSLYVKSNDGVELFVELLQHTQKLQFSGAPNPLLRLKTQLLETLAQKVVLINTQDAEADCANVLSQLQDATTDRATAQSI